VGRQPAGPGRAAWQPRRAVARVAIRGGCLRRGRSGSGMEGTVRGSRWVGGCASHPARRRPGRSRADHRPGRQRPYACQGLLDVAARAAARSPEGGSTADGMAVGGAVQRSVVETESAHGALTCRQDAVKSGLDPGR
jgi:hypothetical protein